MKSSHTIGATGNALLVERQAFFIPYLRAALVRAGLRVSESRAVTPVVLRLTRPDALVLGASGLGRKPLAAIRTARQTCPSSTIVVIAYETDPAWFALARAVGADTVLGPLSVAADLTEALDCMKASRQEKTTIHRTSLPQ